jgi:hypothetical protein
MTCTHHKIACASVLICALLGGESAARAQTTTGPSDTPSADQPSGIAERRACPACPPRSVGKALFQTTIGEVRAVCSVSDRVRPGVAWMPFGGSVDAGGTRRAVNMLTAEEP